MAHKIQRTETKGAWRIAHSTPDKKEHMLVTRDGNVIKGPRFERMVQILIQ